MTSQKLIYIGKQVLSLLHVVQYRLVIKGYLVTGGATQVKTEVTGLCE